MQELREGKHELWLCRDNNITVTADPLSKLLAGSITQDPTASLHQVSVVIPSKRQRKSCKPLRVPPAYESSQTHVAGECGSECPLQQQDHPKLGLPEIAIASEKQQQPGLAQQTVEDITGVGIDEMKRLKPSAPLSVANFSHMQKQQLHYPVAGAKLANGNIKSGFAHLLSLQQIDESLDLAGSIVCRNVDCQTRISPEASFCRRCSCSICKLFDENKDASLWIGCGGCGLSCHIECALKQHVAGVVLATDGALPSLDGSYFCISCRTTTPLIERWKEQLLIAKNAQTVDVLRYRLHLSCKMLKGTKCLRDALAPVDEAVKLLDGEIAQTAAGSAKLAQWCVDRLLCNTEVQKFIILALERAGTRNVDAIDNDKQPGDAVACEAQGTNRGFEHVQLLKNGYASLDMVFVNAEERSRRCTNQGFEWHHSMGRCRSGLQIQDTNEVFPGQQEQRTHSFSPGTHLPPKHKVSFMAQSVQAQRDDPECLKSPSSPYKMTGATIHHERGRPVVCVDPSDVHLGHSRRANIGTTNFNTRNSFLECEDERRPRSTHDCANTKDFLLDTVDYHYTASLDALCSEAEEKISTKVLQSDHPSQTWVMQVQTNKPSFANTKAGVEIVQGANDGHTMSGGITPTSEADFNQYVFSVKVIRWLECQGHLKEEFRMKFLTWYTLSATEHEKRVVNVFIDTLQDEPASLAGQLMDAFEEIIGAKRQPITADGYCRRLW